MSPDNPQAKSRNWSIGSWGMKAKNWSKPWAIIRSPRRFPPPPTRPKAHRQRRRANQNDWNLPPRHHWVEAAAQSDFFLAVVIAGCWDRNTCSVFFVNWVSKNEYR